MSKIVSWGRWPVAIFFALQGLGILMVVVGVLILTLRDRAGSFYFIYMGLLECAPLLLCAWGILRLRRWGYGLAFALSALGVLLMAFVFADSGAQTLDSTIVQGAIVYERAFIVSSIVFDCSILVWLLLPPVRSQYLHKEQIA
ncbi:MAG: hypothetical protein WB987_10985 [Candidatus Acidiferrales bacterium]